MLFRLIYCSRQLVETRDLDVHVESILAASHVNNARDGLTGLLLLHDGWFVQALEGPQAAVQRAYGRIVCDRRHAEATVLDGCETPQRRFAAWTMCARRLPPRLARQRLSFDPRRLDGDSALFLLAAASEPDALAA